MQKARSQETSQPKLRAPSYRLLAYGFRIYFTRHQACFSPFPHGTGSLSVTREYLALGGGPPGFPQDFSCPVVLGCYTQEAFSDFRYGTLTLCGPLFQNGSPIENVFDFPTLSVLASGIIPRHRWNDADRLSHSSRFRPFPVRSPLLRESLLLSVPEVTKMVQFSSFASTSYVFRC